MYQFDGREGDLPFMKAGLAMAWFPQMGESGLLALARALDLRERYPAGHAARMARFTYHLCVAMGLARRESAHTYVGALLHDIGMATVPESILHKHGPLTGREWGFVRQHPVNSVKMLEGLPGLDQVQVVPRSHHERFDGSGYPEGLAAEAIPLPARIFAVVDTWEALTSTRPYRPAWSHERARAYLQLRASQHFDPEVVRAFLDSLSGRGAVVGY